MTDHESEQEKKKTILCRLVLRYKTISIFCISKTSISLLVQFGEFMFRSHYLSAQILLLNIGSHELQYVLKLPYQTFARDCAENMQSQTLILKSNPYLCLIRIHSKHISNETDVILYPRTLWIKLLQPMSLIKIYRKVASSRPVY